MFQKFENMTFDESKEYKEKHPDLAYISLDKAFNARTEEVTAEILLAASDLEGVPELERYYDELVESDILPSIDTFRVGIVPVFDASDI